VEEDGGREDGEGEDEASGDLIEGGVDVFEGVIAEAGKSESNQRCAFVWMSTDGVRETEN
jgi:hypothetical protein